IADLFGAHKLPYDITIRARFGNTVVSLVQAGLGIAVIDQFSVAHGGVPGVRLLEIQEPTGFETFVAVKRGAPLSPYASHFIKTLRAEMESDGKSRTVR